MQLALGKPEVPQALLRQAPRWLRIASLGAPGSVKGAAAEFSNVGSGGVKALLEG